MDNVLAPSMQDEHAPGRAAQWSSDPESKEEVPARKKDGPEVTGTPAS